MAETPTPPHSSNLRQHRNMDGGSTVFITKCMVPHINFIHSDIADAVCEALLFRAQHDTVYLAAYVAMPDHWHAIFSPREPNTLPLFMKDLCRRIGSRTHRILDERGWKWQDSYHDIRIRSGKQFRHMCRYTKQNPVRAGLVDRAETWKWSSADPNSAEYLTRPWPWMFEKDLEIVGREEYDLDG